MKVEKNSDHTSKKDFIQTLDVFSAFNNIFKTHVARQQQYFRHFFHPDNITFVVIINMISL